MSSGGGSKQETKTVYEPSRKTLVQSYTPLYIQQAMADQANTSGRNLELARQAYAQTVSNLSVAPGAGFKAPIVPQYEVFDATKYLPSQEFLAQGQQKKQQQTWNSSCLIHCNLVLLNRLTRTKRLSGEWLTYRGS